MAAVAEEAGVAPGLLHHHFADKADLPASLLKLLIEKFRRRTRAFESSGDPLVAYCEAAVRLDATADVTAARCWVGLFAEAVRDPNLFAQVWRLVDGEIDVIRQRSACQRSAHDAGAVLAFVLGALVLGALIHRWNLRTTRHDTAPIEAKTIWDLAYSPDGEWIASAASDGVVRLWNRQSDSVSELTTVGRDERAVAFSPDGQWLAAAGDDATVRVWDRRHATAGRQQLLTGHKDVIYRIAFSPKSDSIATASFDGTVRLWRLGTWNHRFLSPALRVSPLSHSVRTERGWRVAIPKAVYTWST